jgi:hypothetical protein
LAEFARGVVAGPATARVSGERRVRRNLRSLFHMAMIALCYGPSLGSIYVICFANFLSRRDDAPRRFH